MIETEKRGFNGQQSAVSGLEPITMEQWNNRTMEHQTHHK